METFVYKDHKKLRCGYTTGTCAALAAAGAARLLLGGRQGKVRRLRSGGKAGGRRDGLLAGLDQPQ